MNIRQLQKDRLSTILNPDPSIFWKVLILDSHTKDIISPLLKLNDLRQFGITTYFMIDSVRQKISNVPCIYFIQPSSSNLKIIKNDVLKELYCSYYINFCSTIKRDDLEDLGYSLGKEGMGYYVQRVFDSFIDFIGLQKSLFVFDNCNNGYINMIKYYKSAKTGKEDKNLYKENDIYFKKGYINDLVNKLFSIFVTIDEIPFILNIKKNKYDKVCTEIGNSINLKLKNSNIISKTRKRPLLILLNRSFDMVSPIEHTWTYCGLINDLLDYKLNKVTFKSIKNNDNNDKTQSYELNDDDIFWKENQFELFPNVSEKIEKEVLLLKKDMAMRSIDERTDKKIIAETLEKAPELNKRNESIKSHMSICLEIVERIKSRCIDDFYRLENSKSIKDDEFMFISDKGTPNDILRLVLKKKGLVNDEILKTLYTKRILDSETNKQDIYDRYLIENEGGNGKRESNSMVRNLIGNVKKLLPLKNEPQIYTEIENIYNGIRNGSLFNNEENNVFFKDPLSNRNNLYDTEIGKIIVFVLGTSSYNEYTAVKMLENKIGVEIVFGCDNMVNSEEFLDQFRETI